MEIKELEKMRDAEVTGFFWLGLKIAIIFGIPAFLAVLIGKKIETNTGNSKAVLATLFVSFILSWIIVIYFYLKKSKKIKKIEDEIRILRKEENKNEQHV